MFRRESPLLRLRCACEVGSAAGGETIEQRVEGELRLARGACLSVQRGHDGERCKIQLVKEEDVGDLNLDVIIGVAMKTIRRCSACMAWRLLVKKN